MVIINHPSGDWVTVFIYTVDDRGLKQVFDHHRPEIESVAEWAQAEAKVHFYDDTTPYVASISPVWQEDLLEFFYDNYGIEEDVVLGWSDFAKWPKRPPPAPTKTVEELVIENEQLRQQLAAAQRPLNNPYFGG